MGMLFSRVFSSLFGSKEVRILILGLDNAGKTTILCKHDARPSQALAHLRLALALIFCRFAHESSCLLPPLPPLCHHLTLIPPYFTAPTTTTTKPAHTNTHTHTSNLPRADRLQASEIEQTIPTIGFNVETLQYKNIKFQVWDLGGQTSIRPYWRCYYPNTDALIFVVDSADHDRLKIAKQELFAMLEVRARQMLTRARLP